MISSLQATLRVPSDGPRKRKGHASSGGVRCGSIEASGVLEFRIELASVEKHMFNGRFIQHPSVALFLPVAVVLQAPLSTDLFIARRLTYVL